MHRRYYGSQIRVWMSTIEYFLSFSPKIICTSLFSSHIQRWRSPLKTDTTSWWLEVSLPVKLNSSSANPYQSTCLARALLLIEIIPIPRPTYDIWWMEDDRIRALAREAIPKNLKPITQALTPQSHLIPLSLLHSYGSFGVKLVLLPLSN